MLSTRFGEEMADRKLKMKFAAEDGDYMLAEREHREIQEMAAIARLQAGLFSEAEREKLKKAKKKLDRKAKPLEFFEQDME